ncbi:MAG: Hsp20/alpha crystallin family protein, partial [Comamonadaceae bacterium]
LSPTIRGVGRGVLSIAGERRSALPSADASGASGGARDGKSSVHIAERFHGRFQRVITLPEDADPEQVEARYGDGVLRISVARRAAAQPRRIAVQ